MSKICQEMAVVRMCSKTGNKEAEEEDWIDAVKGSAKWCVWPRSSKSVMESENQPAQRISIQGRHHFCLVWNSRLAGQSWSQSGCQTARHAIPADSQRRVCQSSTSGYQAAKRRVQRDAERHER